MFLVHIPSKIDYFWSPEYSRSLFKFAKKKKKKNLFQFNNIYLTLLFSDPPSQDLDNVHEEEIQNIEEESRDLFENKNNSIEPEIIHPIEESISSSTIEDTPKKSYASILSSLKKEGPRPNKVYIPANNNIIKATPIKTENKPVADVAPPEVSSAPVASSSIGSPDSSNVHDEGDGHSVYIRNLPLNATVEQLETEFNKFGPIKPGGIQVRSNKLGFCFGFVEFLDLNSMQNAIQNSPVVIGGREAAVEIKRTTTRVGAVRGRFPPGRGGFRGRGGGGFNGGGRGYGRSDYGGGRGEFSGRGRGGRGGEGYHQGRGRGGIRGGSAQWASPA